MYYKPNQIENNVVRITDKTRNLKGTGFLVEHNQRKYCITCHHCIFQLEEIHVSTSTNTYKVQWLENFSDKQQDIAVLDASHCSDFSPLTVSNALSNFKVGAFGHVEDQISFPDGRHINECSLSLHTTKLHIPSEVSTLNNPWNEKPDVNVHVYQIEAEICRGFSGSPVYYIPSLEIVGMITSRESSSHGFVIPLQTILMKLQSGMLPPSSNSNLYGLMESGNEAFGGGNYIKALEYYDEILNDPNYLIALNNKAITLAHMGKYEDALVLFNQALEKSDNNKSLFYNTGHSYYMLEKYTESLVLFDKALEIDPNYLIALNNKGLTLDHLNRSEEALVLFDKALKLNPNYGKAYNNKAIVLRKMGKLDDAFQTIDRALQIDPKHLNAIDTKGEIYLACGNTNAAIEHFKMALEIDPNFEPSKKNLKTALENNQQ
ncbi:MAG: tetratricopeptide repeat protein [Candidatus Nitrosocosmicus sp.]